MGVPKFYRWVSERYPNISRVINDNQVIDTRKNLRKSKLVFIQNRYRTLTTSIWI